MNNRLLLVGLALVAGAVRAETRRAPPRQPTIAHELASAAVEIGSAAIDRRMRSAPIPGEIEVAFAPRPEDQAIRLVGRVIGSATKTIEVAAYEFTSKPTADALIEASRRGVEVFVVVDGRANEHGSDKSRIDYLLANGVHVRRNERYPIMHNKFIVVDDASVETGSFNFTYAAQRRNAENVIVVWGAAGQPSHVAALYAQRFFELWNESSE